MNPFPDFIIRPSTAHRIPRTPHAEKLIDKLLTYEVNAYAFLMDVDLLVEVESKGFQTILSALLEILLSNCLPISARLFFLRLLKIQMKMSLMRERIQLR